MIDPPQIAETDGHLTAVIHLVVPGSEIRNVMGPGIGEVRAVIAAQGIAPIGPWFTHHLRTPADTFDFEVGVPVATPVVAAGRVRPGKRPAGRVARTIYQGPYQGLSSAWGELMAWISANGHAPAEDLWEIYTAGPESSPDPTAWRTELCRPLALR